jgi:hypothetical protein
MFRYLDCVSNWFLAHLVAVFGFVFYENFDTINRCNSETYKVSLHLNSKFIK